MANKNYDNEDGVWRTIGGRRVFIKKGQSLSDAMKESGKFSRVAKNKDKYENVSENSTYVDSEIADLDAKHVNKQQKEWSKQAKALEENIKKDQETGNTANRLKAIEDKERYDRLYDKKVYDEGMSEKKFKEIYGERPKTGLEDIGLTEKQIEAGERLTKKAEQGARSDIGYYLRNDKQGFASDDEFINELSKEWGVDKTEAKRWLEEGKSIEANKSPGQHLNDLVKDSQEKAQDEWGQYVAKVKEENSKIGRGQVELEDKYGKENVIKKDNNGEKEEKERLEIAKDIAKEVYAMKDDSPQLEKMAKKLLEAPEGAIEPGQTFYTNQKGELERSTKDLKEWRDELKKTSEKPKEENKSRISDEFTTEKWEDGYGNQFGETSWKGSKANSGLYGKDKIKAIDDEVKKAYPGVKTSRKTARGGYTDSFSYRITQSDKPILRSIDDFSDREIEELYNKGYNRNWFSTKEEFKENIRKDLESGKLDINQYYIDDDYRLTPYGKQVFKDIMKVSNAYNYDESASQVDYFHTGHYINLGVGTREKPYQTTENKINNSLRNKGYQKYMKEHPGSKMTLEDYLKKQK